MSLLDDVKRARGENTTQAQQQFTTSTSSSSNSLLQRVKIARGELQPQSPVVQPTAPTQTFTQKLQQAGSFISGATEKIKDFISPNRTKTPPVKLPTSGNFVTLTPPKVTLLRISLRKAKNKILTKGI